MVFFSRILLLVSLILIPMQTLADDQVKPKSLDELLGSNSPNAEKVTLSSSGRAAEDKKEVEKAKESVEKSGSKPAQSGKKNPDGTVGEQPGVEWGGNNGNIRITSNPDDNGWWVDPKPKIGDGLKSSLWKRVQTKCKPCSWTVYNYNEAMQEVLSLKYQIEKNKRVKQGYLDGAKSRVKLEKADGSISDAGEHAGRFFELIDLYDKEIAMLQARLAKLQAYADGLAHEIAECEKQCKPEEQTSGIKIGEGGIPVSLPKEPAYKLPIEWNGPVHTCWMCEKVADELNSTANRIRRVVKEMADINAWLENVATSYGLDKINRQFFSAAEGGLQSIEDRIEKYQEQLEYYNKYLKQLVDHYNSTLKLLQDCETKFCKKKVSHCPQPPANQAIAVGPNEQIGSGGRLKDKAKELMGGGGGLGGLLGGKAGGGFAMGGGGRGGGMGMSSNRSLRQTNRDANSGPKQEDDPIDEDDKIEAEAGDTEILVGGEFTDDGLLISTDIEDSPGEGTFQTAFIQSFTGQRMEPNRYVIYDLWIDWKLTVTWVYKRYVDGELVEEKHGGWEERWREELGTFAKLIEGGKEIVEGIWYLLGFDQATQGVKSLGTYFPITKDELKKGPVNFVVHTTLPKKDPVMTQPFIFEVSLDDKGEVVIKQVENTLVANDC